MVAYIEMKLSMTTAYWVKKPQAIFFYISYSLPKLANCSMHGGETWCTGVLHHFQDDRHFSLILLKLANSTTRDGTWYACV